MSPISPVRANLTIRLHNRGNVSGKIWILGQRKAGKPLRDVETDGTADQHGNMRRCRERDREESNGFEEEVIACISRHRAEVRDCFQFGHSHAFVAWIAREAFRIVLVGMWLNELLIRTSLSQCH